MVCDKKCVPKIREPRNLAEAHEALDNWVTDKHKKDIAGSTGQGNMGDISRWLFGMAIRNDFGLWGGSPLAIHLRELGLTHPDDMSEVVIDSYRCYLRGEPYDVSARVAYYRKYWKLMEESDETEPFPTSRIRDLLGNLPPLCPS